MHQVEWLRDATRGVVEPMIPRLGIGSTMLIREDTRTDP